MPVYRITVEKFMSTVQEYWTNVYHANVDGGNVGALAGELVAAELPLYPGSVVITKVSFDQPGKDDTYEQPIIYNTGGTASIVVDLMPLFVCGRVDLTYQNSRPGRKYIRATLTEDDVNITAIRGSSLQRLQTYLNRLLQISGLCDEDGDPLTGGAVFNAPAMRQLRRGSKKRSTP